HETLRQIKEAVAPARHGREADEAARVRAQALRVADLAVEPGPAARALGPLLVAHDRGAGALELLPALGGLGSGLDLDQGLAPTLEREVARRRRALDQLAAVRARLHVPEVARAYQEVEPPLRQLRQEGALGSGREGAAALREPLEGTVVGIAPEEL